MKVLQTIGGFGAKGGGTSSCTYELLSAIHQIDNYSTIDILTPSIIGNDKIMGEGEDWIKVVPNDYKTPIAYSTNLSNFIENSDYNIYHTNGLWMHANHSTCKIARDKKKPYIISPHGMLYPEALARSAWKKWPFRKLWFDKDINQASAIHATCVREAENIRKFGYQGPIAIIPNPLNIPDFAESLFNNRNYSLKQKKIGFLGRLHNIKKIENLLEGLALPNKKDISLYIIGKGDDNYEEFLKAEAKRLNIDNQIHFVGFLNGREKFEKLSELDTLFLPSEMENFGMIVPEALIVGTPVMASLGTPWKSLNENNCGWWTDNSPESIAKVIEGIAGLSPEEHRAMGERGRKLVIEHFEATKVASKMLVLYNWILDGGEKPEFVYE